MAHCGFITAPSKPPWEPTTVTVSHTDRPVKQCQAHSLLHQLSVRQALLSFAPVPALTWHHQAVCSSVCPCLLTVELLPLGQLPIALHTAALHEMGWATHCNEHKCLP